LKNEYYEKMINSISFEANLKQTT